MKVLMGIGGKEGINKVLVEGEVPYISKPLDRKSLNGIKSNERIDKLISEGTRASPLIRLTRKRKWGQNQRISMNLWLKV